MMKSGKKKALQLCIAGLIFLGISGEGVGQMKAAIQPGNEVKYNIKPDIFSDTEIISIFSATKKDDVKVYYYDTPNKDFLGADYIHRLRVYKDSDKTDITYKKRFSNTPIDEALIITEDHGFTGNESNYKFEIDIKGGNRAFSISRKEKLKETVKVSFDDVDTNAAKKLILDNVPKKVQNWDSKAWYNNTLSQTEMFGPAEVTKYEGIYAGYGADIEVWNFQGDVMVELSTKEDDASKAATIERLWHDELEAAGYLSNDQRSKTSFVMGN
ncbi:CYTH domain-containing protein [Lederbergia lenta]|uniref:CYTH domain-containing protein n=1 Tax=Lederbergia lenta TaxID=1467 RepID=UPI002042294E|nr:CYTH domain-containing protein [Lederbergia lenta]MCM3112880.1 CYTH domain-containing protein [Lederbergia lenta]